MKNMNGLNSKKYTTYIIIIIILIFLLEIISNVFSINEDLRRLITNFLFTLGGLFLLFGWECKIFILLNIFDFFKFNIGLITNNLIKPNWIYGELNYNLQMIRWIMTVITCIIIIAGFQNKLSLGSWKRFVAINKLKIILYYVLGTIFLQFVSRLV